MVRFEDVFIGMNVSYSGTVQSIWSLSSGSLRVDHSSFHVISGSGLVIAPADRSASDVSVSITNTRFDNGLLYFIPSST
jgi:hypothetical protein